MSSKNYSTPKPFYFKKYFRFVRNRTKNGEIATNSRIRPKTKLRLLRKSGGKPAFLTASCWLVLIYLNLTTIQGLCSEMNIPKDSQEGGLAPALRLPFQKPSEVLLWPARLCRRLHEVLYLRRSRGIGAKDFSTFRKSITFPQIERHSRLCNL